MDYLTPLDIGIIIAFFILVLIIGLVMSRKASSDLESYYLGGRSMPWYMLGMSGMSAWFDLTGTMIITSFIFILGPMGLFVEFRGGAVLVLAFMLSFIGKWHRRSGCMTAAEWMAYRFGTGFQGEFLRVSISILWIITNVGMIGYLVRGATLFLGIAFPIDPIITTACILGVASLYTIAAGYYGVVFTDLFEGSVMIFGCIALSIFTFCSFTSHESLAATAQMVTGQANCTSSIPQWTVDLPAGYEAYEALGVAALFYLARSILGGMSLGTEPRFFAARTPREASLQCLLQALSVSFRWPLMISFAILGIYLVAERFPDQLVAEEVSELVRIEVPGITPAAWHSETARFAHNPTQASPEFLGSMETLLGEDWQASLMMVGPHGTVNPEMILPAVLIHSVPAGLKGVLMVSLMAALMGTMGSMVNGSSALFVRDVYQNLIRKNASTRELIFASYGISILIVVAAFMFGLTADNINDLWSWIIMGLMAGSLGPMLLRLYWWRTNAWGMVAGTFFGGVAALLQRAFIPDLSEWVQFPLMSVISLGAVVIVSLLTKPVDERVTKRFYETTRPFGFWKPFRSQLSLNKQKAMRKEHCFDWITVAVALPWQVLLFMLPMQVITRSWNEFFGTLPLFIGLSIALYFVWYKKLPPKDEVVEDFNSKIADERLNNAG